MIDNVAQPNATAVVDSIQSSISPGLTQRASSNSSIVSNNNTINSIKSINTVPLDSVIAMPIHDKNGYTTITVLPAINDNTTPTSSTHTNNTINSNKRCNNRCCNLCRSLIAYICSPSFLIKFMLLCILISMITLAVIFWQYVETAFVDSLAYIKQLGFIEGAIALTIANIIGAILFLPCVPFTLGAGFLFGLGYGSLIIIIATNIASLVAFITARYFVRSCVERRLGGKNSKFRLIDAAIKQDGFKIVCLVRSSPLHPYGICNYLFGITNVTLPSYAAANLIAMTPGTVLEVWTGTSIHELSDIISGKANQSTEHQIVFWVALLITFIVTLTITLWLKSKLNTEFNKYDDHSDIINNINDIEFNALPSSTNRANIALPHHDDTIRYDQINVIDESIDHTSLSNPTSLSTTPTNVQHRLLDRNEQRSDSIDDTVVIPPIRSLNRTNVASKIGT